MESVKSELKMMENKTESKNAMTTIEIEDFIINVDNETAALLQADPDLARRYSKMIKEQLNSTNTLSSSSSSTSQVQLPQRESNLWKSSKKPTQIDHDATLAFLSLRKQYDKEFADKKTSKNSLWSKIAIAMNEMGFYVGEGAEGKEKCRQKWANMQSSYMKTMDKRKQTGEGKVNNPPYFDELADILADKHKFEPVLLINSHKSIDQNLNKNSNIENLNLATPSTSTNTVALDEKENSSIISSVCFTPTNNRFSNVRKSVRPKKDSTLETLKEINMKNQEDRRTEFTELIKLMKEQNDQRHNQIMTLIETMKMDKATDKIKGKKRRRSSSADDD